MSGFSIETVGKAAVIISFMFVCVAHTVPEKQRIQTLRQKGQDKTPYSVIDKVLIDLCAGG